MAAVIPGDAYSTNFLVPVRFEFASLGSATGAQSYSSATYTKFSGSSFPISSTRTARRVEEDLTYSSCQAGGTHRGAGTNNATT